MPTRRKADDQQFAFADPIYGFHYLVQVGGDLNQQIAHFSKHLGVDSWQVQENPNRYGHFFAYRGRKNGGLWFRTPKRPEVVAHECFHATSYAFECLELPLKEDTEEVFAYYLQWMVAEVVKGMQRR